MPARPANPNRYARPAEYNILRETIRDDEIEHRTLVRRIARAETHVHDATLAVSAAQDAANSARSILDGLKAANVALERRLLLNRGLVHPVRKVPDDLLAEIFGWWLDVVSTDAEDTLDSKKVRALRNMPFCASSVCRSWRLVGQTSKFLWTRPAVVWTMFHGSKSKIWFGYAKHMVTLSGDLPLETRVTLLPEQAGCQNQFVTSLLTRTTTLRVMTANLPDTDGEKSFKLFPFGLAGIKRLVIHCFDETSVDPVVVPEDTQALEHLELTSILFDWTGDLSLDCLRTVSVDFNHNIFADTLVNMARIAPNLDELTISCQEVYWMEEDPHPIPIEFQQLRKLDFNWEMEEVVTSKLVLPQLKEARLSYPTQLVLAAYSNLRHLHIWSLSEPSDWFEEAVNLEDLEIEDFGLETSTSICDVLGSTAHQPPVWRLPKLVQLKILNMRCKDDALSMEFLEAIHKRRRHVLDGGNEPALLELVTIGWEVPEHEPAGFQERLLKIMTN